MRNSWPSELVLPPSLSPPMRRTLYGQRNMWSSWLLKRMPRPRPPPPPPLPLTKRHNISHTTKGRKGREREGGERGGKKERLKSFQQPTNEAGKLPAYSSELLKLAQLPCPSIHPVPSDAAPSIHPSIHPPLTKPQRTLICPKRTKCRSQGQVSSGLGSS